jgi:hypothetical protein
MEFVIGWRLKSPPYGVGKSTPEFTDKKRNSFDKSLKNKSVY